MMEIRRLRALVCLGWLSLGMGQNVTSSASSSSSVSGSGSESEEAPVTMMDAGSFHTVVIIRDNAMNVVKNWGANGKGQVRRLGAFFLPGCGERHDETKNQRQAALVRLFLFLTSPEPCHHSSSTNASAGIGSWPSPLAGTGGEERRSRVHTVASSSPAGKSFELNQSPPET